MGIKPGLTISDENQAPAIEPPVQAQVPEMGVQSPAPEPKAPPPWSVFLRTANHQEIKERFSKEVTEILVQHGLGRGCNLALLEPENSIDNFDLDKIFGALREINPSKNKDVVLFLLSRGGDAEAAYQISKLCKSFAPKFTAVIPRQAKSAATLVAIGADEVHMGPLGQLGPIDPQIGGLPALGVSQALRTVASIAEQFPGSADMFARYLQLALTVEQIGYCDRISESAVQYAVRLLSTKPHLANTASTIARQLVHEYKDHAFVIDITEARQLMGDDWIRTETVELRAAEAVYTLFDMVSFFLRVSQSKRLVVSGGLTLPSSVLILEAKTQ